MYKKKLCLGTNPSFNLPEVEQIGAFKAAGFEGFFTGWNRETGIEACALKAKEAGMLYQSVHAPFSSISEVWHGKPENATAVINELIACLKDCEKYEVPIMVSHVYIGFDDPRRPDGVGLARLERLVDAARGTGVKIAFENTEGEEYLAAVMEHFRGEKHIGFCWDTGHEQCYNFARDMTALYGDRLICTHLNDNLGISDNGGHIFWTDDLHLLPFDGISDWQSIADRLDKIGYDGILTFELKRRSNYGRHDNDMYMDMPIEQYLAAAYNRACRVAALMKK